MSIGPPDIRKIALSLSYFSSVFIFAPIVGFILGVLRAKKLIKKEKYSIKKEIFQLFGSLIVFSSGIIVILFLSNYVLGLPLHERLAYFMGNYGIHWSIASPYLSVILENIVVFLWILAISCFSSGIGILFYIRKDSNLIKLSLSFIFVFPAIISLSLFIIIKLFPL